MDQIKARADARYQERQGEQSVSNREIQVIDEAALYECYNGIHGGNDQYQVGSGDAQMPF